MTLNKLASLIAKREGKKHQASIGDIREILRIVVELCAEGIMAGKYEGSPLACLNEAITTKRRKLGAKKVETFARAFAGALRKRTKTQRGKK